MKAALLTSTFLVLNFAILARQYFAILIDKYEKGALNFAIQAFSTLFYFSKILNF